MAAIDGAGCIPRQVGIVPLSSRQPMRVNSRTMQGTELVDRIEARLKALNLSAQAASLKVGENRDLIRNVLRFGAEANPRHETLTLIARALDWSVEELMRGNLAAAPPAAPTPHEFRIATEIGLPAQMPKDLPVWGSAAGSFIESQFEGVHIFTGEPVDYVRRPPALAGVRDAYAIYVTGDSMEPMHPHGALRLIHPHRPPSPGDSVVVMTRHWDTDPGQGYIKILRRRSGDRLLLEQLNPPARIEIPVKYVVTVHKVLDMNDLFGV